MMMIYNASTIVYTDHETVADFFKQHDAIKNYFPEVKKDISSMGEYVQNTHAHPTQVLPDYMVAHGFGWMSGAGIQIRVPRKDVAVDIVSIDVDYSSKGANTRVTVEVTFDAPFNTNLPLVMRCIRAMVKAKLNAFERDIHTHRVTGLELSFA